jgi:putative zinc finger protein/BNR/Asp-box repeat protein
MNTLPETPKPPCPVDATYYAALLPRLHAGTLSPAEREGLRRHLNACPTCQDEAAAAADRVVAEGVQRQFGIPAQAAPFLTLDDIRHRATLHSTDAARATDDDHILPTNLHDRGKITMIDEQRPETSTPAVRPGLPIIPHSRWRTVAAVTSAVALIALFALLLRGFAAGKGASGPANTGGTATSNTQTNVQTPPPTVQGQWHPIDGFIYTTQTFTQTPYPQFSPKNPAIVYETTLAPITVRRSDNGGASWQTLKLPSGSDKAIDIEIFASPLDAHAAFLTVTVNLAYGQGPGACPSSSLAAGSATHGNILASGQVPCSTTYRSTDEGKTWHAIAFPINGTLSTPLSDSAPYAGSPIQAQGTRLYAMLNCGPTCVSSGNRLVKSTDGGASWHVADAGGLGQGVCDFAAQPGGQTIFAAVSRGSCDVLNSPALALDRSDDAGATWVHVSYLPQGASQGMKSVLVGGKYRLYINIPAVSWQPHIISVTQAPNEFSMSNDGGHTWKTSPLKGVPAKVQPVIAPLMVRDDGSLVVAFALANTPNASAIVYSWKPGDTTWREFAPAPHGPMSTLLRTVSATGAETYWAVIFSGSTQQGNTTTFTFAVSSYQP